MRDDLDKLPLPRSAKRYARMTSKDLGSDWGKKVDMYMDMAADLTNQDKNGFKNQDASGKVKHAFKEAARYVAGLLLNENQGDYHYVTCCVNSDSESIMNMVEQSVEVSASEFFRNVPLSELFASGVPYYYHWTPKQCAIAGVDYHDRELTKSRGGLRWKDDWAISYHKSVYRGEPCYYYCHSAIEYVFVKA